MRRDAKSRKDAIMDFDKLMTDTERELNELKASRLRSAGILATSQYRVQANFYSKKKTVYDFTYYYSARMAIIKVEPTMASATNFLANIAFEGPAPKLAPICYRRTAFDGYLEFVVDWTNNQQPWQYPANWNFDQTLVITSTAPVRLTLSYEDNQPPYDE